MKDYFRLFRDNCYVDYAVIQFECHIFTQRLHSETCGNFIAKQLELGSCFESKSQSRIYFFSIVHLEMVRVCSSSRITKGTQGQTISSSTTWEN